MFLAIAAITVLLSLKLADWRNWRRYEATMLFFMMGNLYYNYVYHDHWLWEFIPDIFNTHVTEIIYSFTVYPLTVLMYLSRMPLTLKKKIFHTSLYIAAFVGVELFLFLIGKMDYNYGWSYVFSFLWNLMMFPLLYLHHKKPVFAYGFCVILIFVMGWLFPYNLS